MSRWLLGGVILSVSLPLAAGCSEDTGVFGDPATGGSVVTTTTSTTGGGAQGGGGTTTTTGGAGGSGAQGGAGGTTCEPEAVGVQLRDLDMVIMADRSGSMWQKWTDLVTGVSDFALEPRAPGTSVALVYHPVYGGGAECLASSYNPPHVPLTPIPANGADIAADLGNQSPMGPSPWSSVVEGALQFATAHQTQEPEHVVVTVLIVDTDPNVCDTNVDNVAGLAASAFNLNGVRTFGIALPPVTLANVSNVAAAGGTVQAFDLTAPGDLAQLQAVLNEIHRRAVPCEYDLPDPPSGPLDPDEVNLTYTPGGSGTPQDLPRFDSEPLCGNEPGWTYDDPAVPTKILLCPASCDAIKQDTAPLVEVWFGCPTIEG